MTLTANPQARRRTVKRYAALAAVVLVPLAFAGLFVGAIGQGDKALTPGKHAISFTYTPVLRAQKAEHSINARTP